MSKIGKKHKKAISVIDSKKLLSIRDAVEKVKELSHVNFDESVDLILKLSIDPTKNEQTVRGDIVLPNNRGKRVKIIVFAKGEGADQAKEAGADEIGDDNLIENIKGGWLDFDYAIATPDLMGKVGALAKILGPRGLLPNKKNGTVTFDIAPVIKELKQGRVFFKNDKSGQINFPVGKVSFDAEKLVQNINSFLKAVASLKPASVKGRLFSKITISSTMGVGILIDIEEVFKMVSL